MRVVRYLALFPLLAIFSFAFADSPEIYSHKKRGAVKGIDVVAYYSLPQGAKAVKGSNDYTYEWKGATWKFSSQENLDKFRESPEAYAPQYGGYCAFAVAHGFTTSPRPDNWRIVDGKLYLNNNRSSFKKWLVDQDNKIAKADENWPKVLEK
ncbi:YHS domain-containing (seleno)protein [Agarilytica rhodophyticola]|uniref:YHS domain-containing (seleno)protein n=1 Tax=Agarilytica rhodophyticola TaxID=1737490 RepID=UPI000B349B80|nr:YHS domain-containing (seleno)protein [Agarilytica rhodophyticola]